MAEGVNSMKYISAFNLVPWNGLGTFVFGLVVSGDVFEFFDVFDKSVIVLFGDNDAGGLALVVDDVLFFNLKHVFHLTKDFI